MHYRSTYRGIVRAALAAQPEFAEFQNFNAWSQAVDEDELPFYAVATPKEAKERSTHSSSTREITLAAVFKVLGGDTLEDVLDDLSIVAERVILEALSDPERDCQLSETMVKLDGSGGTRVGTLILEFTITIWPAEPITL